MKYWVQCPVLYTRSLWRKEKLRSWDRGQNNCVGKGKYLMLNLTRRVRNNLHGEWKTLLAFSKAQLPGNKSQWRLRAWPMIHTVGEWEAPRGGPWWGALLPYLEVQRQVSRAHGITQRRKGHGACGPGPLTCPFPSSSLPRHSCPALAASVFFHGSNLLFFFFFRACMKSFYFVSKYERVWLDLATKKKKKSPTTVLIRPMISAPKYYTPW